MSTGYIVLIFVGCCLGALLLFVCVLCRWPCKMCDSFRECRYDVRYRWRNWHPRIIQRREGKTNLEGNDFPSLTYYSTYVKPLLCIPSATKALKIHLPKCDPLDLMSFVSLLFIIKFLSFMLLSTFISRMNLSSSVPAVTTLLVTSQMV